MNAATCIGSAAFLILAMDSAVSGCSVALDLRTSEGMR